jgi:hypothetical protein
MYVVAVVLAVVVRPVLVVAAAVFRDVVV